MTYYNCHIAPDVSRSTSGIGGGSCHKKARMPSCWLKKRLKNWKASPVDIRHRIVMSYEPRLSSLLPMASPTRILGAVSTSRGRLYRNGANAFLRSDWPDSREGQDADARVFFPPDIVMQVKALACQLPKDLGLPFSRLTVFLR